MSAAPPLRVGHSILAPGAPLTDLDARLSQGAWDMVEIDVLGDGSRLVVAHDRADLRLPDTVDFSAALHELVARVGPDVRFDVDVKGTGYEPAVAAAIADAGIGERTLVSTMHRPSLRALRETAPALALGLSVPLARRDHLASRWTRPGALAMLAALRRTLPRQMGRMLDAGEADAVMAHWGVVTDRLVSAVRSRDAELFVWTVDDPVRLAPLLELGVSGIISNRWSVFDPAAR